MEEELGWCTYDPAPVMMQTYTSSRYHSTFFGKVEHTLCARRKRAVIVVVVIARVEYVDCQCGCGVFSYL
jgi:hypothetical protein